MSEISKIKNQFLSLNCPFIEANEDEIQIKNLLLKESAHKEKLKNWIEEILPEIGGIDYKSLSSWRNALKMIEMKQKFNHERLDKARNYLDFVSKIATPSKHDGKLLLVYAKNTQNCIQI